MNSMAVEGSMKMVISLMPHQEESTVYIPQHIASSIRVPYVHNGIVCTCGIQDGDYGILLRQPVLWHGGIRGCRICVLQDETSNHGGYNVLSSMGLPISMCSSFGADFDGDEMTLFPVKTYKTIEECKASMWDNSNQSPYTEEGYRRLVPPGAPIVRSRANTLALATTICWSDRTRGYKVNETHSKWMTTVRAVVDLKRDIPSPLEFARRAMNSMSSSITKSSLQSDIGATSRRSKLGAERRSHGLIQSIVM